MKTLILEKIEYELFNKQSAEAEDLLKQISFAVEAEIVEEYFHDETSFYCCKRIIFRNDSGFEIDLVLSKSENFVAKEKPRYFTDLDDNNIYGIHSHEYLRELLGNFIEDESLVNYYHYEV